MILISILN